MCKYFLLLLIITAPLADVFSTDHKSNVIRKKILTSLNAKPKHDFPNTPFSFANVDAPKGGKLVLANQGSFDGLNRFTIKGLCPLEVLPHLYDTLMYRSPDEPFSLYPLVAKEVDLANDSSFIIFYLDEDAKFSDGSPVESEDIESTIHHLKQKIPRYKNAYSRIDKVTCINKNTLRIDFIKEQDGSYNKEAPMIMGLIPVLPKKILETIDISEPSLKPIIGSGPYELNNFESGRFIELKRRDNYWAKNKFKGFFNFDIIRVDYYKNVQAQFQAFQAGNCDVHFETSPQMWHKGYDFHAVKKGRVKKVEYEHSRGVLSRYFIVNMRKSIFQDIAFRKALTLAFDADDVNRRIFKGEMKIPYSVFSNTHLAHHGKAEGAELEILSKYKDEIADRFDEITSNAYARPETKNKNDHREHIKKAAKILDEAGYKVKNGICYNKDGKALEISLMLKDEKLEKIALGFKQNLKQLGVNLHVQRIDSVQYENKVIQSDFDIIIHGVANSMSPGVEQILYYSAKTANEKGSSNYIGLSDPALEALAKGIPSSTTNEELIASCQAMDRYLMHLYCLIPIMYDNLYRAAYWVERFDVPKYDPSVGTNIIAFGWSKQIS